MCYLCTLYRVFNICCENSQKSGFLIQFWGITVGLFDPLKLPDFCTVFSFFFPLSQKCKDEEGFLHTDWVSEFECTDRVSTEFERTDSDDRVWTHRLSETESVVGNETEWHCLCLDFTECEHRDWVQLCSRHMTDTVLIYDEGAVQVLKINDAGDDFVVKSIMYRLHGFGGV